MNKKPSYLKNGDTIAIVAVAGRCNKKHLQTAIEIFQSWGLKIKQGKHLFDNKNQFAASDKNRLHDLNSMIEDNNIKAIISLRGGYGSVRLLEDINYPHLAKNPKWIIGFSDITAIHSAVAIKSSIASLHATMPVNFADCHANTLDTLHNALFGNDLNYKIKSHKLNRNGNAKAEIVGGNLSVLYSLRGTEYDINTNNKILFIEDLNEYLYHLDRMMMNLKLGGKLSNLKGLILGAFSDMKDNDTKFGKTAYEIIAEAVKDYDYPVIFDFKAGHIKENNALIFGVETEINVNKDFSEIKFL
jgi:muramoyltetrapeptide carboxypeptidase